MFIEVIKLRGLSSLWEAAESRSKFPFKIVNGTPVLVDLKIIRTVQAAIHIAEADQGIVVFVSNENDMLSITIEKDESFWDENIQKIREFFDVFVKYLAAKSLKIH